MRRRVRPYKEYNGSHQGSNNDTTQPQFHILQPTKGGRRYQYNTSRFPGKLCLRTRRHQPYNSKRFRRIHRYRRQASSGRKRIQRRESLPHIRRNKQAQGS